VSLADRPSQSEPEDDHKNDQPPHAEWQVSSPGMRDGIGSRIHSVLTFSGGYGIRWGRGAAGFCRETASEAEVARARHIDYEQLQEGR
jgi:hypothetical protein